MSKQNLSRGTWKSFKKLMGILKHGNFWMIFTVISSIAGGISAILLANGIKGMADAALNRDIKILRSFLYIIIAAFLLEVATSVVRTYSSGKFINLIMSELRMRSQEHVISMPLSYMDKNRTGDLMSRLTHDIGEINWFISGLFIQLITSSLMFIIVICYLFTLNWQLTLVSGILIPAFTLLVMKVSKNIESQSKKQRESLGRESNILQDSIMGLTEIKSFGLDKIMYEKYCKEVDATTVNTNRMYMIEMLIEPIGALCRSLPFIVTMFYGGYLVVSGNLTYGGLLAYVSLSNNIVDPVGSMPRMITAFRSSMAAVKRVFEIWDAPVEREKGGTFPAVPDTHKSIITFDQVTFSYGGEHGIFNNLCFSLKRGETVALVGASGCGKSTVLRLITDFYQPSSGTIKLYGHNLKDWSPEGLRTFISEVLQDNYLFPDTLYQNIIYGKPDASMEEVERAAKIANIYDFIQKLPDKFDTVVGERGVKLSGGQKQRVAIARAILKDAPILLLDEATSALDTESEQEVQQALEKLIKGRTTLVIAHRLSTIKNVDRILVMDEGKIVEEGTHEELIQNGSVYKLLYNKQFAMERPQTYTEAEW